MRQINEFVDAMFSTLPQEKEVEEIKRQILEHMEEKFDALREQGMNEAEALGTVILEFGSIDEIKQEICITEVPQAAPHDEELDRLLRGYDVFAPRMRLAVACAVFLFILAPILGAQLDSILLLFVMIAVGVGLLIYFLGRKGDYLALIEQRQQMLEMPEGDSSFLGCAFTISRKRRQFYCLLSAVCVVFYLLLGFLFNLWHPGWIVFLLVPFIIGIMEFLKMD